MARIIATIIIPGMSASDEKTDYDLILENSIIAEDLEEATVDRQPLPMYFVDAHTWPKTTNLQCSMCSLPIQGGPNFIPHGEEERTVPAGLTKNEDIFDYVNDRGRSTFHSGSTKKVSVVKRASDGLAFCDPFCRARYVHRVKDDRIPDPDRTTAKIYSFIESVNGDGRRVLSIEEAEDPKMMNQYSGTGITPKQYRELNKKKKIVYA